MTCTVDSNRTFYGVFNVAQTLEEPVGNALLNRNIDCLVRDVAHLPPAPLEWRYSTIRSG